MTSDSERRKRFEEWKQKPEWYKTLDSFSQTLLVTMLFGPFFASRKFRQGFWDFGFGLRAGAILDNPFYELNGETLEATYSAPGHLIGWDPARDRWIENASNYRTGVLWIATGDLEPNSDPDKYSLPAHLLTNREALLSMDKFGAQRAIEEGYLRKTPFHEALGYPEVVRQHLDVLKNFEHLHSDFYKERPEYVGAILASDIGDRDVFVVTPKGNTRVHLLPDDGDTKPKEKPSLVQRLLPAFG